MSETNSSGATRAGALFSVSLALAGVCALLAVGASNADAQTPPSAQAAVETRRASLKKMGAAMKAIVEQLKTASPDNAKVVAAAQAVSTGAESLPNWFPAGSGPEAGVDTDALPHIWEDRTRFDTLAQSLLPEARRLAAISAGADTAAVRTQLKVVSEICSNCHKSFRAD